MNSFETIICHFKEALIHFRWSPPAKANGELIGYKITCWRNKNGSRYPVFQNVFVSADLTEFVIPKLLTNENYVFTVSQVYNPVRNNPAVLTEMYLISIGEGSHRNRLRERNKPINGFNFDGDSNPSFNDLHCEFAVVVGFG